MGYNRFLRYIHIENKYNFQFFLLWPITTILDLSWQCQKHISEFSISCITFCELTLSNWYFELSYWLRMNGIKTSQWRSLRKYGRLRGSCWGRRCSCERRRHQHGHCSILSEGYFYTTYIGDTTSNIISNKSRRFYLVVGVGQQISLSWEPTFNWRIGCVYPFTKIFIYSPTKYFVSGIPCYRVLTSDKDNLTLVFNEIRRLEEEEVDQEEEAAQDVEQNPFTNAYNEDDKDDFFPFQQFKYRTNCCYGLSMDLLENIAQELEFDFRLYIVADGFFGSRTIKNKRNGRIRRDIGKNFLSYR